MNVKEAEKWLRENEVPLVFDVQKVVRVLGLSRDRVDPLVRSGKIHGTRTGRRWQITRLALAEYLCRNEEQNGSEYYSPPIRQFVFNKKGAM